jgi:gamma-tubulin complex component 2
VDTLRSLLELVLRNPSSVSYSDPYKEDITVELSQYTLVEQLIKVTSVVGLDYRTFLTTPIETDSAKPKSSLKTDMNMGSEVIGGLAGIPNAGHGLRGILY